MTGNRNYKIFLNDIIDSIDKGANFIKGISFEQFSKDDKTQYAVVRAIEIIGEASKKNPNHVKEQSSEIPWREMSDILIHNYFGVNKEVVWETVKKDFPELKEKINNLLKDL